MSRKYYNNGIINKMIKEGDPIPEGFVPGMKPRSEEDKKKANEKRKKTCIEKYGGIAPLCSDEVRNKSKNTNIERYGVENPSKSENVKEKRRQTNLKKYGVENPAQSESVQSKMKATTLERYGVENPFQSEEIKAKIKAKNKENLGVDYPMQSEEAKEKAKQTSLERYGVEHALQSEEFIERLLKTNNERYGHNSPMQSEEVKNKLRQTYIERYGVDNPMKSSVILEKLRRNNRKKYGVDWTFQAEIIKKKVSKTCQKRYGYLWSCMRPEAKSYSNDSSENREFAALLESYGVKYEREFPISRYSYDFKVGNRLIEIDPFPFHNTIWSPIIGHGPAVDRDYHQRKSHKAESQGYQVIHIFDWDDKNKIVQSLLPRETVYARKCSMREVPYEDCTQFLIVNHLQGSCRGQDIRLGLYINDELISIMTFGYPRYNKNYQYELLRYCSSKNVIGGAGKLLANFLRTYDPESVISYCDRSKFRGDVYSKLGFILKSEGKPSCHWYSPKEDRHITDNLLRARGYDQIFNESYGKGTSNEELIINRGYYPVYDCGQDTYLWIKDKCR